MRLLLDACALIYRFEGAAPFREATTTLVSQLTQNQPAIELAVSRLSVLECRVKPLREGNTTLLARYDELFASVRILELSAAVVNLATQMRARYGLKTHDALQTACALEWDRKTLFVTGDAVFAKVPTLDVRLIQIALGI